MKYYAADVVLPVSGPAIKRGIVALNDDGVIQGLFHPGEIDADKVQQFSGVLIPGFINAHCHLELSHMLGVVPRKTGLPKFIAHVINQRGEKAEEALEEAIQEADRIMYENGIQAVGDHVNTAVTAKIKEQSRIKYHTFIEVMALKQSDVLARVDQAKEIEFHFDYRHSSVTPHAPYSGSKHLFKALKRSVREDNILSIHNQESEEENKLFRYKKGEFLAFYEQMGMDVSEFKAQARNSLQSYLPYIPVSNKLILVHNTYTSLKDLDFVERLGRKVYFCFCPKANLYIEGRLPRIENFLWGGQRIVLGTDSLASNDSLDILEELKTIHAAVPDLEFSETIKWATLNGAEALDMDEELGSLDVGKRPGLVLLEGMDGLKPDANTTVRRIR
ncbi:MAG: amidohydrolase family protein [Sphingobacterium sp.]